MKITSKLPGVGVRRLVMRLWHSIWIAYWEQKLNDPVEFTSTMYPIGAVAKYNHHVRKFNALSPHNADVMARPDGGPNT